MNSTHEMVTFDPQVMLGIVDLRSLGYYKIKQGVLQNSKTLDVCIILNQQAKSVINLTG